MHVLHSRLLVSLAATAAIAGFLAAGTTAQASPRANSATSGDDTPVRLTPKGEIADELAGADERQAGHAKTRDAYYWSPLLTDNPAAVGSAHQPYTKGAPGAANLTTVGGNWANQGPSPIVQVA